MCFVSKKYEYNVTGKAHNYSELFTAMRAAVYSDWDVLLPWHEEMNKHFNDCVTNTTFDEEHHTPPIFEDHYGGWMQATNWVIRHFGPDVTFGW